jgi:RNA-directed DNA polymerase
MMHGAEKSDSSTVAKKSANQPRSSGAESMERREGTKENTGEPPASRTQSREIVPGGLDRVRQAARGNKKERFTALMHHVTPELLWQAYHWLKRSAAPGVDGVRWHDYEENLEARLVDLHARVHRGSYHPLPSRRKYIAKADGRMRPLGIAALEDKIVQRAVVEVLNAILTSRTSWDSHTDSGLGAGRMTRSMHWPSESRRGT